MALVINRMTTQQPKDAEISPANQTKVAHCAPAISVALLYTRAALAQSSSRLAVLSRRTVDFLPMNDRLLRHEDSVLASLINLQCRHKVPGASRNDAQQAERPAAALLTTKTCSLLCLARQIEMACPCNAHGIGQHCLMSMNSLQTTSWSRYAMSACARANVGLAPAC